MAPGDRPWRATLLLVAALTGLAFAGLAAVVAGQVPAVSRLDLAVHEAARAYSTAHPAWLATMRAVTHIGDTVVILAVDTAVGIACLRLGRRRAATFIALAGSGTWLVSQAPRHLIQRGRPADPLWSSSGYAFPSGHTTNTTATVLILAVLCWPLAGRAARFAVVALAVAVPVAVGVSRIAGGVHWPTDVLGGLLLATTVVAVVAVWHPPWARSAVPDRESAAIPDRDPT